MLGRRSGLWFASLHPQPISAILRSVSAPLNSTEIDALLRLLDDETPVVRERVSERLASSGGDLSDWFARHPRQLSPAEAGLLTGILLPARRETLDRQWQAAMREVPDQTALGWPESEFLLGLLADFLHDGITPRVPVAAALDELAAAARTAGATEEMGLRNYLFETRGFKGNQDDYHDPRNCDLAWCLSERRSNPLGLCLIFILVGRRLGLTIEGVAFPGHFLCRILPQGVPVIVDCFNHGQVHIQDVLLEPESDLTRQQRSLLRKTASPTVILVRLLNNLAAALQAAERETDFQLVQRLRATLDD